MKIAFIDLAVHRKTKSTRFIIDDVLSDYQIDEFYLETNPSAMVSEIASSGYELVICFQTEFVAPIFLMADIPTVIIPMFDAIEHAPSWYWEMMGGVTAVNFSKAVNHTHKSVGIRARFYQYWNKRFESSKTATFEGELNGFFWQRRPEQGLSWRFASRLLGNAVDTLHVHNSPDHSSMVEERPSPLISNSKFGKDNSLYLEKLEDANIFLCPRYSEGLGHTIIEAMSKGMCVIANNSATHNEYIVDGLNGLLIDYYDADLFFSNIDRDLPNAVTLNIDKARALGEAARLTAVEGIKEWDNNKLGLKMFLLSAPQAFPTKRYKKHRKKYLIALQNVFSNHADFMARVFTLYTKGMYIDNGYRGSRLKRLIKSMLRYGLLARSLRKLRRFVRK